MSLRNFWQASKVAWLVATALCLMLERSWRLRGRQGWALGLDINEGRSYNWEGMKGLGVLWDAKMQSESGFSKFRILENQKLELPEKLQLEKRISKKNFLFLYESFSRLFFFLKKNKVQKLLKIDFTQRDSHQLHSKSLTINLFRNKKCWVQILHSNLLISQLANQMNRKGQIGIFIIFLSSMAVVQCYSFDDYVIEFGKAYKTKEQYDFRKEIFEANYSKIIQNNLNNESNQLSPTTWTDRTLNQTESVLSFKPDINAVGSAIPTEQLKVSAPRMIDWRFFRAVSRIKDQGYCGSCWAFAAVAAFQSYVAIRTFQLHDLAQQSLLQCTPGSSCYGGSIQTSMSRAATYGLPSQSSYLYSAKYSSTNSYSKYPGICNASLVIRLPNNSRTSVYVNLTHQQMKTQIAASPMAIAIAVNYEFMQFRGKGVFSCRRNVTWWELNHAVEVVGYDWDGNYIIKNSWGTMWGDMGYIVLNKTFSCGVGMYSVQYTRNTQINNTNTTNATTSTESTSNSTQTASNSTGSLTNNSAFRNFLCFAIPILLIVLTF